MCIRPIARQERGSSRRADCLRALAYPRGGVRDAFDARVRDAAGGRARCEAPEAPRTLVLEATSCGDGADSIIINYLLWVYSILF